ncbi:MAG: hypothetical protein K6U12_10130 [Armatimonadetes bacterium]|nr:hypothetical protein [Armatimonadota bacterium]
MYRASIWHCLNPLRKGGPSGHTTLLWRGATYRVVRSVEFRLNDAPVYRLVVVQPV